MKFKNVRYVFLSSLHPDYYGGFPGFYLSSREAMGGDFSTFKMGVVGPPLLKKMLHKARAFTGSLNLMEIYEYGKMDQYFTEVMIKLEDGSNKFLP
jgi:ribonuclease BN (tRNA processing enzyme)